MGFVYYVPVSIRSNYCFFSINMTPLDEFKKLVPEHITLTEDEFITFRDIVDLQADMVLDAYLKDKADGII